MARPSEADSPSSSPDPDLADAVPGPSETVAILDTVDIPIVVVGRHCELMRFNRAAADVLLLTAAYIGERLEATTVLGEAKGIEKLCSQAIADDTALRRDILLGDRHFLVRAAPYALRAGHTEGAVLTFTNVTAFRASVQQAIYEREYTKAILNTVAIPLVVLDSRLRVQSGNRAFYSMFGVARERANGVALYDLGDDEWRTAGLWSALTAVASEGNALGPTELERDFPAIGRRTVVLDARRVARDGDTTILLALQDITEHRHAERELQKADRRKDEFLALLAHELRNPLAPIRTGLELMRLSSDIPPSVGGIRDMMERQVTQMVRLVDDLLDVSRIASGKIVLQREPTSLAALLQSAIETHRVAIESALIDLAVDLPSQRCIVNVDATRFVQILSNVLHNASKFTPAHGRIRCAVDILADAEAPRAVITISDTGVGISTEMVPQVFEMFTQGDAGQERAGGLGIGLALARRLTEMHEGRIEAHSDGPGRGSTFTITVPLCDTEARQLPPPDDVPRVSCRVVVIDDNRDAASTTSMLVERLGASARTAHDAATGLAIVEKFKPDVIFLDIGMPGIDGYEACRRVRLLPSEKRVVIVAVTGWGQSHDKQRALDAGFDAHLTKPVDPATLARVLARSQATH